MSDEEKEMASEGSSATLEATVAASDEEGGHESERFTVDTTTQSSSIRPNRPAVFHSSTPPGQGWGVFLFFFS